MARMIEWPEGRPFALLVEPDDGTPGYIVPPVVMDLAGNVVEGLEVLAAVIKTGVTVPVPILRNVDATELAEIDQALARMAQQLGVVVGLPGDVDEIEQLLLDD